MKDLRHFQIFVLMLLLLATPAIIEVAGAYHDAVFSNIPIPSKVLADDIFWLNITARNDKAGISSANLYCAAYLDSDLWFTSSTVSLAHGRSYTWNYQTSLSLGNHTVSFVLYDIDNVVLIEDISKTYNVSVVDVYIASWQPQPLSLQQGKATSSKLNIFISNGGSDTMHSPTVYLGDPMGLTFLQSSVSLSDIPAGGNTTFSFSVSAPSSVTPGSYNIPFSVNYKDFAGTVHTESETAQIEVASLGTSLTLTSPSTARIGSNITISAKLLDGNRNPMSGQTISFSIGGMNIGSSDTDISGTASVTYTVNLDPGTYNLIAAYDGSTSYGSSSTSATLVISPLYLTVITTLPRAQIVSVNGTLYTTDTSGKTQTQIAQRGAYIVEIVSPHLENSGTRDIFQNWADGLTDNPRTVEIDTNQTLSVVTKTQYLLTLNAPPGSSTSSGDWCDPRTATNATIQYSWASDTYTRSNLISYSLDRGSNTTVPRNGSGTFSVTVNMTTPHTLTFYNTTQFHLIVSGGYNITFGTTSPTKDAWYDKGTTTTISSDYLQNPTNPQNRQRLLKWSLDRGSTTDVPVKDSGRFTTPSIPMNTSHTVTFTSIDQYYVLVISPLGTTSGSGWYDKGTTAFFSVTPTSTFTGLLISNTFSGWSGDSTDKNSDGTILVNAPATITAQWTQNSTYLYIAVLSIAAAAAVSTWIILMRRGKKPKIPTRQQRRFL